MEVLNVALLTFAITSCVVVIIAVALPLFKGQGLDGIKPVRANLVYLAGLTTMLLLFVAMRGFDWLASFVPDTDWWDGATFMGALIAIIGIAAQLISMIHTIVSALTQDPPDKPTDHLTLALKMLHDRHDESPEEKAHYAAEAEKERQNRLEIARIEAGQSRA